MPPPVARPGCACPNQSCVHCGRRNPDGGGISFRQAFLDPLGCTCSPSSGCPHCWPDRVPLNEVDPLAAQRPFQVMAENPYVDLVATRPPMPAVPVPVPTSPDEGPTSTPDSTPEPHLPATCDHCGNPHSGFSDDGKNQPKKYCSDKCRYRAGNARKRSKQRRAPGGRPVPNVLRDVTIPEQ